MSRMSVGQNTTVGTKMMLAFGSVMFVVAALAGGYLYSVATLGDELKVATGQTAQKVFLASELKSDLYQMRSAQRGVMLYSMHNATEEARQNKQDFDTRASDVRALVAQIKPLLVSEKNKLDAATLETELEKLRNHFEQVAAASMGGKGKEALEIAREHTIKSFDAMQAATQSIVDVQKQFIQESFEQGDATTAKARWTALGLLLAALGVLPFVVLLLRRITNQLRGVAAHLAEGAEQITGASAQVASSSQTLAQGASEQAGSLEETSSSSEEITSMTRKNAENSQAAAALMSEVDRHVSEGNTTLEEMVRSMAEITGSSDKISKIIKVIDEIAFQTNILALNAAVEAARAGEAGRGFAVVADEVRNLAQRSAQAAKDTASLIEESIAKSNEGSRRLEHVAQVMGSITESAVKVKTLVDEVNLGSQEQARGIEQISKSISEMDRITQANAASAEESASASEEMSAQAESLQNIANDLRVLVGGGEDKGLATRPLTGRARPLSTSNAGPKSRDIEALRTAVAPTSRQKPAAHTPALNDPIPLEDDFVNM